MAHKINRKRVFEKFMANRETEREDILAPLKKLEGRKVSMKNTLKNKTVEITVTRAKKETNLQTGAPEVVIFFKSDKHTDEQRLPLSMPDDVIDFVEDSKEMIFDYQKKERRVEDDKFLEKMRRTNDHGNTVWTKPEHDRDAYTIEFKFLD